MFQSIVRQSTCREVSFSCRPKRSQRATVCVALVFCLAFQLITCVVVAPINLEADNASGRRVRLSILEEDESMEKRDSIMTPAPRISEGGNSFFLSSTSAETEYSKAKLCYSGVRRASTRNHTGISTSFYTESPLIALPLRWSVYRSLIPTRQKQKSHRSP